mgnify:CR=1 FL=1
MFKSASKIGCYPKHYPTTKAYETMSLFEGLLAYYEVKKNPKDIELVKKFVEDAFLTERSVIGGLSGKGELFDGFYESQTEKQSIIVQETCVTVTWMRLLRRLYLLTKDEKYMNAIKTIGESMYFWPVNRHGGYWHMMIQHNQMWLDGAYMAGPLSCMYEGK